MKETTEPRAPQIAANPDLWDKDRATEILHLQKMAGSIALRLKEILHLPHESVSLENVLGEIGNAWENKRLSDEETKDILNTLGFLVENLDRLAKFLEGRKGLSPKDMEAFTKTDAENQQAKNLLEKISFESKA
jgi:hypothetical protein